MTSTQERLAYCLWLGGVVAELANTSDPRGRSLLRADKAGKTLRHTAVVNAIGDLEAEAKRVVWHEVVGMFGPFPPGMSAAARGRVKEGEQRRIDLVSIDRDLGGSLIDPTVVDPVTPTEVAAAAVAPVPTPNRAVDKAEQVKVAHYPDVPRGFRLCPVGLTTQAGCGALGQRYLTELALTLARRRNGTESPLDRQVAAATREVRERVTIALMRSLADRLAAAIVGSPHKALTTTNRYTHSAYRKADARAGGEAGADGQPELGAQLRAHLGEPGGRLLSPEVARAGAGGARRRG
jgi:hypothetical protein